MAFRARAVLAFAFVFGSLALPAQSQRHEDLATGKLLVAPRQIPDPNFAESVILLVHYDSDGALGLMLNHRTRVPISRALPDLKGKRPDPVFVGGPVEMDGVLALLRASAAPEHAGRVFGNIYVVSTTAGLNQALVAGKGPGDFRIYLGYCGWGAGQLDNEVKHGAWYVFDRSESFVFDSDPASLWDRLVARTGLSVARLFHGLPPY